MHSPPSGYTVQIVNNGGYLPFCSIQPSLQPARGSLMHALVVAEADKKKTERVKNVGLVLKLSCLINPPS